MDSVVFVLIYVCGTIDTVIWKEPDKKPAYVHASDFEIPAVRKKLEELMKQKHIKMTYQDKRSDKLCI